MPKKKTNTKDSGSVLKVLATLRISLGAIFLWAFIDKLWGLGFATCRNAETNVVEVMCQKAWAEGGSPTTGFLKFATQGPLEGFYQNLAGVAIIDWLFMLGLLGAGVGLILGIGIRLSTTVGIVMMLMMWSAALLPENNPILDDHIIYALVLAAIAMANKDQVWGFAKQWESTSLVKKYPILK